MRAVKSVSIDSERRVIITFLDGSTETLYPNCIWCDSEALRQLIKDLLEEKADAIVQTINNVTIASFADGADEALIKKLLVSIEPIQEGTGDPTPENIRPISGRTGLSVVRTGKNLLGGLALGEAIVNAINRPQSSYFGEDANGKFVTVVAGSAMNQTPFTSGVKFKENTQYTIILKATRNTDAYVSSNLAFVYTDGTRSNISIHDSSTTVSTTAVTSLANKTIKHIEAYYGGGVSYIYYENCGIFEGVVTEADYESYKGSTYAVSWETEAGTVYGGSLDLISGKLTVTHELITCHPGDLGKGIADTVDEFYVKATPKGTAPTGTFYSSEYIMCSCAKNVSSATTSELHVRLTSRLPRIIFPLSMGISSLDLFNTWLEELDGPLEFRYKLETPITYQLTPQEITTLLGTNNIWADSGDILELEYVADTKLYIDESQSATLGSERQTITKPEIQPVSDKTVEDLTEAVKDETEEKETQKETEVERGE